MAENSVDTLATPEASITDTTDRIRDDASALAHLLADPTNRHEACRLLFGSLTADTTPEPKQVGYVKDGLFVLPASALPAFYEVAAKNGEQYFTWVPYETPGQVCLLRRRSGEAIVNPARAQGMAPLFESFYPVEHLPELAKIVLNKCAQKGIRLEDANIYPAPEKLTLGQRWDEATIALPSRLRSEELALDPFSPRYVSSAPVNDAMSPEHEPMEVLLFDTQAAPKEGDTVLAVVQGTRGYSDPEVEKRYAKARGPRRELRFEVTALNEIAVIRRFERAEDGRMVLRSLNLGHTSWTEGLDKDGECWRIQIRGVAVPASIHSRERWQTVLVFDQTSPAINQAPESEMVAA